MGARTATSSRGLPTEWERSIMRGNEAIIAETLGRAPDRSVGIGAWRFARWRQFIGSYDLPALVDPVFVVHVGGKPDTRFWEVDRWSEARSIPGCATI
ncbi:hypothetical protein LTR94_031432, partial [Friedmanniomyces endolithicus]